MSLNGQKNSRGFALCISGVPGAGKTTLLRKYVEQSELDMHVIGSSIVKAIIAPASVNDLDGWPSGKRDAVRAESIRTLCGLKDQCAGRLLVDGHFTLRNRKSGLLEPIFTAEDKAFFNALILINPTPESVLAQRVDDARSRGCESIESIDEHVEFERQEAQRLACEMGVPLLELVESSLSERLRVMSEFLGRFAPLVKS